MHNHFVPYLDAQVAKDVCNWIKAEGPFKEVRSLADQLSRKLASIRDIDYSPLSGYQLILTPKEDELYTMIHTAMEEAACQTQ